MKIRYLLLAIPLLLSTAFPAWASVTVGSPAPDFSLVDSNGKTQTLSQYKGKLVVLEWSKPDCPIVAKHYESGNIPKQQANATASDVVWLTINSEAVGKPGHLDRAGAAAFMEKYGAKQTAYLLDDDGKVGHMYGAKAITQSYIIDRAGVVRYSGGFDSIASADKEDIAKATQFLPRALAELKDGKEVSVKSSEPYGCDIEYRSQPRN